MSRRGDPKFESLPASWSTSVEALALLLRGATVPTATPVAIVVGTILSLVNQGQVVWSAESTAGTWVRIGFNYLVPFLVASWGFLAAARERGER